MHPRSKSRYFLFKLVFIAIAVSTFLVCCALFYLFGSDHWQSQRFSDIQALLPARVQLPLQSLASYPGRLSNIQPTEFSSIFSTSSATKTFTTLGITSNIFILSLPRRVDRRMEMNALAQALRLDFVYVDGVEATDASVDHAIDTLKLQRQVLQEVPSGEYASHISASSIPTGSPIVGGKHPVDLLAYQSTLDNVSGIESVLGFEDTLNVPCATEEDPFPIPLTISELRQLPSWRILSRGMIACWIGHLKVIHKVVRLDLDAAMVLEDDVDMEFDIKVRLMDIWSALDHTSWDIVMLGHCHSNETKHAPLPGAPYLRPSVAPKCTHAYAISRAGAMKLVRILSAPGFAYSRALDQAISSLVSTEKLLSYSVVPAIIVQNRRTNSDIWRPRGSGGTVKGSKWQDVLMDSTLERLEMMADADWAP